jgi:hypothetical protein
MRTVNEKSIDIGRLSFLSLEMPSQDFIFAQKESADAVYYRFSGSLDEMAKLPTVTKSYKNITIHLGGVTALNSYGTRLWCAWLSRIGSHVDVRVEEAPVVFVKSFSAVKGCLPPNVDVMSFKIPFFSEATSEHRDYLAIKGKDFFSDGRLNIAPMKDSKGNPMEMDIIPASYLAFLKK